MKIIEALKKIEELTKKAQDIRSKIGEHSAHLNVETPIYPDQKGQVTSWLDMHRDLLAEILRLRIAIQKTNLETEVTINIGNPLNVTKTIAEWIWRRRALADTERSAWRKLTDKGLKEGLYKDSQGRESEIKIVRCYDPTARDIMVDMLTSEPSRIDSALEITNAITDIIE